MRDKIDSQEIKGNITKITSNIDINNIKETYLIKNTPLNLLIKVKIRM